MKVELLSRDLIKPYTSTPPSLRDYRISLFDELSPAMNTPTIFYYPFHDVDSSGKETATSNSRYDYLKKSLSKTLTRFYPLAGRYIKGSYIIDCSDQGVEFVEAKVFIRLDDLISQGKDLKVELLNLLLPRPVGACDEITDPLLALQLNSFACGGYAISVMSSHRVADMSTTSTFITEWASASKLQLQEVEEDNVPTSPSWNSASLFPGKKMAGLPFGFSRTKENVEDHGIITKKFFFHKSAILRIQEKAKLDGSSEKLPTRVQSVFGIIGKAIIDIHAANLVNRKEFLIAQAINMRERLIPPLTKNLWGNLYLFTFAQSFVGETGVELHSLVHQLSSSVKRVLEKCKMLLSLGDEGQRQMMIAHSFNDLTSALSKPQTFCAAVFSDWSKFPFYEADFGWGKPVWVSTANIPLRNGTILIADESGEGIEAWVDLNVNDMPKFEKDSNIMEFTT